MSIIFKCDLDNKFIVGEGLYQKQFQLEVLDKVPCDKAYVYHTGNKHKTPHV